MTQGKDRIVPGKLLYPEEAREEFMSMTEGLQVAKELFNPIARATLRFHWMAAARHNTTAIKATEGQACFNC